MIISEQYQLIADWWLLSREPQLPSSPQSVGIAVRCKKADAQESAVLPELQGDWGHMLK